MRVVIAPDSFKGSATAVEVARALAAGWRAVHPDATVIERGLADGGEGTLDALRGRDGAREHRASVLGPDGRVVQARWLAIDGVPTTAILELAESSGLTLMDELAPLDAHTVGLGEAIRHALDAGMQRLLIAIGGSASTDGGAGALTALGARLLDEHGEPIALGGRGLAQLARLDLTSLVPPPSGGVTVLTDVTNPLLGPHGAAAVYGPQKGASPAEVRLLDDALGRFAEIAHRDGGAAVRPEVPGAGAAGGTGFGLALWGATLASGAHAIADAVGLDAALDGADLVITGEGRFDGQSSQGKVVSEVSRRASERGIPRVLVAGAIAAPVDDFVDAIALADLAGDAALSIAQPLPYLTAAGERLAGRMWAHRTC